MLRVSADHSQQLRDSIYQGHQLRNELALPQTSDPNPRLVQLQGHRNQLQARIQNDVHPQLVNIIISELIKALSVM